MSRRSPEQISMEKLRAKSDTELIRHGAELVVDKEGKTHLETTEEQKEDARKEMEYTINDKEKAKQEVKDYLMKGDLYGAIKIAQKYELPDEFITSEEIHEIAQKYFIEYLKKGVDSYIDSAFNKLAFFRVEVTDEVKKLGIKVLALTLGQGQDKVYLSAQKSLSIEDRDILDYGDKNELFETFETALTKTDLDNWRSFEKNSIVEKIDQAKKIFGFNEEQICSLVEKVIVKRLEDHNKLTGFWLKGVIGDVIELKNKYGLSDQFIESSKVQKLITALLKKIIEEDRKKSWTNVDVYKNALKTVDKFKIDRKILQQFIIDETPYLEYIDKAKNDLARGKRGDYPYISLGAGEATGMIWDRRTQAEKHEDQLEVYRKYLKRCQDSLSNVREINSLLTGEPLAE